MKNKDESIVFPIRILYLLGGSMLYGGTEAFIMNYYRHMDHEKIIIDFVYQGEDDGVYDVELRSYGSKLYHVPLKKNHPIEYSWQIFRILKENQYKVVHAMMDAMSVWPLFIARIVGVPIRIAHSHNTDYQATSRLQISWNYIAKYALRSVANVYWACGVEAGKWLFGEDLYSTGKVKEINNAIDLKKYSYDLTTRHGIRKLLGIDEDAIVIGHVGQFREQKNHKFLIDLFAQYLKKRAMEGEKKNIYLVLVGNGILEDKMKKIAKEKNVFKNIIFMGARNDVNKVLNIFDVFCFPSLYEGLSVVCIEAQCNGLPCLISKSIAKETIIGKQVVQVNLNAGMDDWIQAMDMVLSRGRTDNKELIQKAGYDISIEAKKLENRYLSFFKN